MVYSQESGRWKPERGKKRASRPGRASPDTTTRWSKRSQVDQTDKEATDGERAKLKLGCCRDEERAGVENLAWKQVEQALITPFSMLRRLCLPVDQAIGTSGLRAYATKAVPSKAGNKPVDKAAARNKAAAQVVRGSRGEVLSGTGDARLEVLRKVRWLAWTLPRPVR